METGEIPEDDKNSETVQNSEPSEIDDSPEDSSEPENEHSENGENAEDPPSPKKGVIRWKSIIFFVILGICAVVIDIFFLDDVVKNQISFFGRMLTGTQTGVKELALSTVNLKVDAGNFTLVDPENIEQNLVAANKFEFAVDPVPLLEKKVVIDTIALEGVRWNEQRSPEEIQAQLEKEKNDSAETGEEAETEELEEEKPSFILPDLAPIKERFSEKVSITKEDLATVTYAESLKKETAELKKTHSDTISGMNVSKRIDEASQTVESCAYLKTLTTKDILDKKKAAKAKEDLKRLDGALKDLMTLKNEISKESDSLKNDSSALKKKMEKLPELKQQDLDKVKGQFSADEFSKTEIAGVLFGEKTADMLQTYGPLVKKVSKLFPSKEKSEKRGSTSKGTTIEFGKQGDLPGLLIREISFSGEKDGVAVSGKITGITSNPKLYGKPATLSISSSKPVFTAEAVIDRTGKTAKDTYSISVSDLSAARLLPSGSPIFPFKVEDGKAEVKADIKIEDGSLYFKADFIFNQVKLSGTPGNVVDELIMDAVQTTPDLTFTLLREKGRAFRLISNLDEEFRKKAKQKLDKFLADKQEEAEKLVNGIINEETAGLKSEMDSTLKGLASELDTHLAKVKKTADSADAMKNAYAKKKKKAEEKLKAKATDAVKEKAGDKLKGLLK